MSRFETMMSKEAEKALQCSVYGPILFLSLICSGLGIGGCDWWCGRLRLHESVGGVLERVLQIFARCTSRAAGDFNFCFARVFSRRRPTFHTNP